MFAAFMDEEKTRERLLLFHDGERRLANLLQLSELLQEASSNIGSGMKGLAKWLRKMRRSFIPDSGEMQLCIESDSDAVNISTVHKCKGLEYPIVFCPFSWEGLARPKRPALFHDPGEGSRILCDLGSKGIEKSFLLSQREIFAENLRLLYVSLTRAKSLCHLFWGRINSADTSAMAYLFHFSGSENSSRNIIEDVKEEFRQKSDDEIVADLKRLESESNGAIELSPLDYENIYESFEPSLKEKDKVSCRKFSGKIDDSWRISSFSRLVSNPDRTPKEQTRDPDFERPGRHDSDDSGATGDFDPFEKTFSDRNIFSFPKGARAGIFFHEIFEFLDFQSEDTGYRDAFVNEKIGKYDFDPVWKPAVMKMIHDVLSLPLLSGSDMTLSSISPRNQIHNRIREFWISKNDLLRQYIYGSGEYKNFFS